MAFRDPIVYLVIKIWIKSKLPKIEAQPKVGLVKIENPKGPIATKIKPKQLKGIGFVCNPTICSLHSIALIGYISLVSTPNCDPFKVLDS